MYINLATILKNYYTFFGSKIIFVNGMTLNQLALEMWEKLGFEGVDASVLSRFLKGERLLTPHQLEIFCRILKLDGWRQDQLTKLLLRERILQLGFDPDNISDNHLNFTNLVFKNLVQVRQLEHQGHPQIAIDLANMTIQSIYQQIPFIIDSKQHNILLELLGYLLYEVHTCSQLTHQPGTSWNKNLRIGRQLMRIAKLVPNKLLIHQANYAIGDVYYITGQYSECIDYQRNAIVGSKDPFEVIVLRNLSICYAHLGDKTKFSQVKNQLLDKLSQLAPDYQIVSLEGLARAEAVLGHDVQAYSILDRAQRTYQKINHDVGSHRIIRQIAIINAHLEVANRLGVKNETRTYRKLTQTGIKLASDYGYIRHGHKTQDLFNKLVAAS